MQNINDFRFITNEALRLSALLSMTTDELSFGVKSLEEISKEYDRLARELSFTADSIKDMAYQLTLEDAHHAR